jgi:hypothetical protein
MHLRDDNGGGSAMGADCNSATYRSASPSGTTTLKTIRSASRFALNGGVETVKDQVLLAWLLHSYRNKESLKDLCWGYRQANAVSALVFDHQLHVEKVSLEDKEPISVALQVIHQLYPETEPKGEEVAGEPTLIINDDPGQRGHSPDESQLVSNHLFTILFLDC